MVIKLEKQLNQEKEENKACQTHIKRSQLDIIYLGEEPNDMKPIKSLFNDKDNTIQVIKKKLSITSTKHVQNIELTTLQQEKYFIYQEMMTYKGKVLKLENEKQEW